MVLFSVSADKTVGSWTALLPYSIIFLKGNTASSAQRSRVLQICEIETWRWHTGSPGPIGAVTLPAHADCLTNDRTDLNSIATPEPFVSTHWKT